MSLDRFRRLVQTKKNLTRNDSKWFPRWLHRYALFVSAVEAAEIPVNQELVIQFLQALRSKRTRAWQRLQAARAVELYELEMLRQHNTDFAHVSMMMPVPAGRPESHEKPATGSSGTQFTSEAFYRIQR